MPNTCNGLPCQLSLNTVIFHTGAKPERNLSSKKISLIHSLQGSGATSLSPVLLLFVSNRDLFKQRWVILLREGCRKKSRNISRSEQFLSLLEKWQMARDSTTQITMWRAELSRHELSGQQTVHRKVRNTKSLTGRLGRLLELLFPPPPPGPVTLVCPRSKSGRQPRLKMQLFHLSIFELCTGEIFLASRQFQLCLQSGGGWCVISWESFAASTHQIQADLSRK